MPIAKYSSLQKLVLSLSKAEKRHFVLYVNRLASNKEVLFVKLFHLIDRHPQYDEAHIYKTILKISRSQFVNTKRHLYSQLLKSLRILHEQSDSILLARQRLDYASILYSRGQYFESLALLNSIKHQTTQIDNIINLEVLEFKKKIESRHITRNRSAKNKIEQLISDSVRSTELISIEAKLSSASLEVQGLYIKWGFAKNEREAEMYRVCFESLVPSYKLVKYSPIAMLLWHQTSVWYHYMRLDFHLSYKHAVSWLTHMEGQNEMVTLEPDLYMRGFHYVLTSCFYLNRDDKFEYWFDKYKLFRKQKLETFNETSLLLDFCYFENAHINSKISKNQYSRIDAYSKELLDKIGTLREGLDIHRILIFHYKLAMLYSYKGQYEKAIEYLNKIIDSQDMQLRADIFSYSRLLQIMFHYRINNFTLVLNMLPNVKNTFESNQCMNPVVDSMILFLRKGSKAMNFGINELMESTLLKVKSYRNQQYEKLAFLYYDFELWLRQDLL